MGSGQLYELPVSVGGFHCLLPEEACCSCRCSSKHTNVRMSVDKQAIPTENTRA